MAKKLLAYAIAAASLQWFMLASPAGATNGYFSHGYGVKAKGNAGAGIALPQDALAIATNPAGLTQIDDQINAGIELFQPKRGASIHGNAYGPDQTFDGDGTKSFLIPEFAFSRRLDKTIVTGVAIYGNGGMNTDYSTNPYSRFGGTGKAGVDLAQVFISPAVAWQITASQSIGAALNLAYQRFEAKGLGVFSPYSSDASKLSNNGHDSSTGVGIRLGWNAKINELLSLGATWQSKTKTGEFDDYRGLFAEQGGFDIPENYGLGLALRPVDKLSLALDWQRIEYSGVKSVGNSVANLFAGNPLGSDRGGGFGWRDISVWKLGAIYQVSNQLTLRAGYSHTQQPIPASETFFNILAPGVITKQATLGATWAIDRQSEVSFSYLHGFKETVHGSGSIPATFGGGNADIHLEENSFGAAYTYKY
ncbi:MAG: outer membrane protein transport protein [Spongiibacteraceae bacterium]